VTGKRRDAYTVPIDLQDGCILAGVVFVVLGLALVHPALGLVALGVVAIAAGLLLGGPTNNQGGT
jgi:hypothetical protein